MGEHLPDFTLGSIGIEVHERQEGIGNAEAAEEELAFGWKYDRIQFPSKRQRRTGGAFIRAVLKQQESPRPYHMRAVEVLKENDLLAIGVSRKGRNPLDGLQLMLFKPQGVMVANGLARLVLQPVRQAIRVNLEALMLTIGTIPRVERYFSYTTHEALELGTKLFGELRLQALKKRDMPQAVALIISKNGYEMQVTEHLRAPS